MLFYKSLETIEQQRNNKSPVFYCFQCVMETKHQKRALFTYPLGLSLRLHFVVISFVFVKSIYNAGHQSVAQTNILNGAASKCSGCFLFCSPLSILPFTLCLADTGEGAQRLEMGRDVHFSCLFWFSICTDAHFYSPASQVKKKFFTNIFPMGVRISNRGFTFSNEERTRKSLSLFVRIIFITISRMKGFRTLRTTCHRHQSVQLIVALPFQLYYCFTCLFTFITNPLLLFLSTKMYLQINHIKQKIK